ncbi:MAG: GGDEF domain-containing protein, partial [Burkholderiaceae bacterium]
MHATLSKPAFPIPNPADIGVEVLRRLAESRIAPTPDAYRALYDELAGCASLHAETVLARFGKGRRAADEEDAGHRIRLLESRVEQLSGLVCEDQLTGCLNRRGLDDLFGRELRRADRLGTPLCAAMLDLDDFKKLNDRYGHCVGDEVLVHLAQVMRQTLRGMDGVGRFGGEEFLILLPGTPLEKAAQALERLRQALSEQGFHHRRARLPITFSAGLALHARGESQR